jgi:hypothetical protein
MRMQARRYTPPRTPITGAIAACGACACGDCVRDHTQRAKKACDFSVCLLRSVKLFVYFTRLKLSHREVAVFFAHTTPVETVLNGKLNHTDMHQTSPQTAGRTA